MLKGAIAKVEEVKKEASKYLDPNTNKFDYSALNGKFPEGVDPAKKEAYLDDKQFQEVFNLSKDDFNNLKKWKQTELRKAKGLF